VYSNLPENFPWVAPVGRLDLASEGLLLLTNDSEWAARISAPETHLDKTYHAQIDRIADENLLDALRHGIRSSEDGELLRAKRASLLRRGGQNSWIEIVLDEGKNRQIRRMLEQLQIEVLRLVRVAIGPAGAGRSCQGRDAHDSKEEKQALDRGMKMATREPALSR